MAEKKPMQMTHKKVCLVDWFHKSTDYVDQMWLDGAYMGSAHLAQLAEYSTRGNTNIFGSTSARLGYGNQTA